ncbi:MAG: hypothetical protein IPP31_08025 [Chitinophagaceae bacterium]|nr:hypothetical protein [Chitinophagaceae bacterium]
MKRFLISFLFILFCGSVYAQFYTRVEWAGGTDPYKGDSIYYDPGYKLSWKDFKGQPDMNSVAAAITSSGFGYTMAMNSRNNKATLVIKVSCFFTTRGSWVKKGMRSDYALLHEQHHFDITYIVTCRFFQKLKNTAFTRDNYSELLDRINRAYYEELETLQNEYDGQTRNGQLKDVQLAWNKKIDGMLAALVIN